MMADFGKMEDVDSWVKQNGEEKLREAVQIGTLHASSERVARAWIDRKERIDAELERAAAVAAARDAAESAKSSAFWTMVAAAAAAVGAIATAAQAYWSARS
ncbi:MAG: hypothetical protein AD742_11365 [Methylibium sp. NZG]|nr:MAG: hypothetical protein AD742_11365 [Methylibium sp. NZG]